MRLGVKPSPGDSRPAIMQLSKSSTDLAIRLMHELNRYRSDQLDIAAVAHFFLQAIEDAVDGPKNKRRKIAALVCRIDLSLLDALSNLGQQINFQNASAFEQTQYSSAITRFLHALLPEFVRQITRIEAGQEVDVLSRDQHSFGNPVPAAYPVRKRAVISDPQRTLI